MIHETKPFEIELHSIGEVLIGRVLYQNDQRIRRGCGVLFVSSTGFQIYSQQNPVFSQGTPNILYIRGTNRVPDCKYFTTTFNSVKSLETYVKELTQAIDEFQIENTCSDKRLEPGEIKKIL